MSPPSTICVWTCVLMMVFFPKQRNIPSHLSHKVTNFKQHSRTEILHAPANRKVDCMDDHTVPRNSCHHSKCAVNGIHLPKKKHPKLFLDCWDGLALPLGIPVASVFGSVLQFLQQWMAAPQDGPCLRWHQVETAPHLPARGWKSQLFPGLKAT